MEICVSKPIVFLNATQHELTEKQVEVAKYEFKIEKFLNLKDLNPDLFTKLSNVDPSNIDELAENFAKFIDCMLDNKILYVHLPIGSPAFMFVFARKLQFKPNLTVVFSHTQRITEEQKQPDGSVVKKSKFIFEKYITIKGM